MPGGYMCMYLSRIKKSCEVCNIESIYDNIIWSCGFDKQLYTLRGLVQLFWSDIINVVSS